MSQSVQSLNQVRKKAQDETQESGIFNYQEFAELYSARDRKTGRPSGYKRFETAAEAVRYFVEELPAASHQAAYLEIQDVRFHSRDIRRLYDSPNYPLKRRALAGAGR